MKLDTSSIKGGKDLVTLIIAAVMTVLWIFAAVVAALDGNEFLAAVTPFASVAIGWLFASKIVSNNKEAPKEQ